MKILAAAGSSGGHIFPAQSFLDAARSAGASQTLLVLPKKNVISGKPGPGHRVVFVTAPLLRRGSFSGLFKGACDLVRACLESMELLLRYRPDVVVGFGSAACVPVVFFAWFMRIPTLVHEQNVVPGKATRFLALFVDMIAVSFEETAQLLKVARSRVRVTGNPIRKDLVRYSKKDACAFFGLDDTACTILVAGGSQASHRINEEFARAACALAPVGRFQVIHLAGESDKARMERIYKDAGIPARVYAYLDAMRYAYSAADMCVTRAGAATICELMYYRLPAVLIPYAYARGHQLKNAQLLSATGAALVIEESRLGARALQEAVDTMLKDPQVLALMRKGFAGVADHRNAAQALYACARVIAQA